MPRHKARPTQKRMKRKQSFRISHSISQIHDFKYIHITKAKWQHIYAAWFTYSSLEKTEYTEVEKKFAFSMRST